MPEDVPRHAVVLRFRPTDPSSLLGWADKSFRQCHAYRLSVFVGVQSDTESDEEVVTRLLNAAQLGGIKPEGNRYYWLCTSAGELLDAGFEFYKDGTPDEPPEHYSVDLGSSPTVDDVERFLVPFRVKERWPQ